MAAKVHPYSPPVTTPQTGHDLMSTPITTGVLSRREKETQYVVGDIERRLKVLEAETVFSTYKVALFSVTFLSLIAGILLILVGTHTTVIFQALPLEPGVIAVGGLFCLPIFYWVKVVFLPNRLEYNQRKSIKMERQSSKSRNLFDQITNAAKKFAEPPPRRIKVFAVIRKKEYPIVASTWKSFCEEVENKTSLAIERQLVKFRDEEVKVDFKLKLDEHYGMDSGDKIFVYNRGGFDTQNSPIRKQYQEIVAAQAMENRGNSVSQPTSWMESIVDFAKLSFSRQGSRESRNPHGASNNVSWNV
eukprot:gene5015-5507_t